MTYQQILQSLREKKYQSIYFLHGEESYFIDTIVDYIDDHVLAESEKAFNHTVLYGKEIDHKTVLDVARRFPMMASYQVVLLKEAQEMKTLKELKTYFEKPAPTTILVIAHKHKKFNFNSKFGKLIKSNATVLDAKRLYDNQVPDWIMDYLKTKKLKINLGTAQLIGEYLGTSLSKIANELDKLAINLAAGTEVTNQLVEENIGISKDYNVFELQNALGRRDPLKTNRIISYFIANPKNNPAPMVMGALYNYFSKVYMLKFLERSPEQAILSALNLRSAYFLKDYKLAAKNFSRLEVESIISILRTYDLKSKGVDYVSTGKEEGALLREMVWKILHSKFSLSQ
jgi:DNA polymerase-3 subunit delta